MAAHWPDKDPEDILDYGGLWQPFLAGDTIASSTWTVPEGLTKQSEGHDADSTLIWLADGTDGVTYTLLNRIVTTGGRRRRWAITITVKAQG